MCPFEKRHFLSWIDLNSGFGRNWDKFLTNFTSKGHISGIFILVSQYSPIILASFKSKILNVFCLAIFWHFRMVWDVWFKKRTFKHKNFYRRVWKSVYLPCSVDILGLFKNRLWFPMEIWTAFILSILCNTPAAFLGTLGTGLYLKKSVLPFITQSYRYQVL